MLTRGKRLQRKQQEQHRTCPSPIICNIAIEQPELKKNQSQKLKGQKTSFPKGSKTAAKVGKVASKIVRLVVGEDEDTKSKVKPTNQTASSDGPEHVDINDIMTEDEDSDERPNMHYTNSDMDYHYPSDMDYHYSYNMGYHYPYDRGYYYPYNRGYHYPYYRDYHHSSNLGYRYPSDGSYLSSYLISRTNSEEVYNPVSYSFLKPRPLYSRYTYNYRDFGRYYYEDYYKDQVKAFNRDPKISKTNYKRKFQMQKETQPKKIKTKQKFIQPSSTSKKITHIAKLLKDTSVQKKININTDEIIDITGNLPGDNGNNIEGNFENINTVEIIDITGNLPEDNANNDEVNSENINIAEIVDITGNLLGDNINEGNSENINTVEIVDITENLTADNAKNNNEDNSENINIAEIVDITENLPADNANNNEGNSENINTADIVNNTGNLLADNGNNNECNSEIINIAEIVNITGNLPGDNGNNNEGKCENINTAKIVDISGNLPADNANNNEGNSENINIAKFVTITGNLPGDNASKNEGNSENIKKVEIVDITGNLPVDSASKNEGNSENIKKAEIVDIAGNLPVDDANNNEGNSGKMQNSNAHPVDANEVNNNESNQIETGPTLMEVDDDVIEIITNYPLIEILNESEESSDALNNQELEERKLEQTETAALKEYGVLTYYISSDDEDSDDDNMSCKIVGTYERNLAIIPTTKKEPEETPKIKVKEISAMSGNLNDEEKNKRDKRSIGNTSQQLKEITDKKESHVSVKPKEITKPKITIVELSPSTVERLSMGELNKQSDVLYISSDEESDEKLDEAKQGQKCPINAIGVQTPQTMEGLKPSFNNDEVFQAATKGIQAKSKLPEPASTVQNLQEDLSLISDEESVVLIDPPIIDLTNEASTSNATREMANNANTSNKRKKKDDDAGTKQRKINKYETSLTDSKIIADKFDIDRRTSENIVKFFQQDYTIPFIARYRKSDIGHLDANVLREVKEMYDEILELRKRKATVLKNLIKKNDDDLKKAIVDCTNIDELNSLYQPFASTRVNKLSQALENGLETVAMNILENKKEENLINCVRPNVPTISDIIKVEQAIVLILANHICTRPEILNFIESEKKLEKFIIQSKRSKSPRTKVYPNLHYMKEERKYQSYYNFTVKASKILPHQILALNRGKENKMLSVLYTHADSFLDKFIRVCSNKWYIDWFTKRGKLLRQAIQYAYDKIVCPIIQKYVKATLKMKAEKCSINVFSNNLRQLLLKAPIKGKSVLGIDPGFRNGCKLALISGSGSILETTIIYPHVVECRRNMDDLTLQTMLLKYSCNLVALGNGKGCKETEMWLAHLIQANFFAPLEVKYAIVNESGSSIYSCSREAAEEFRNMDPCLISAVHLARRFQDPLLELVKVDPKNLGIGMYQHDLHESKLQKALDTVISECVSNVGVDLNTASHYLLRHVSGLTSVRAANIIAYREAHGLFKSREHLKRVRGIGDKTYEQCAGFLKIMESDISNKLDSTIIHPESYEVAKKILRSLKMTINDVGLQTCIVKVKSSTCRIYEHYYEFGISKESMKLILEALSAPLDYDFRGEFEIKPLMQTIVTSMRQLKVGHILEGRVTNLTTFGCFVHVGCEKDGLIPSKELENVVLGIGDKIQVEVLSFDANALRLSLRYLKHV